MKDRNGHELAELITYQDEHLAIWRERLQPRLHEEIAGYVKWANLPAADESGKHRIFRGQDLVEIIRTWPFIGPEYPVRGESYEGI